MLSSFTSTQLFRSSLRSVPCRRPIPFFSARGYPRAVQRADALAPHLQKPPSFREQLYRDTPNFQSFKDGVKRPPIGRQIWFFIGGSLAVFGGCALLTHQETKRGVKALMQSTGLPVTSHSLRRWRHLEFGTKLKNGLDTLKEDTKRLPQSTAFVIRMAYAKAANFLLAGNDGRRMAMWIIAANVAVYILWKVPRFIPMMNANFTHHPLSGKAYTMLTCMFSHQSLIHLGFNCMVLASFAPAVVHHLTLAQTTYPNAELEATPQWHFVAFYVAAGLFASLASHVFTTRITYPRLISKLTAAATSRLKSGAKGNLLATANKSSSSTILPSLGASGAIYAMFTLTALSQPDVQIRLIIPPTPDFPISWGLYGMLIFDTLGILRGWRMMDHVAHLGGAAFGAWYYYYGQRVWAAFRHKIVRIEFKLRGIS